MVAALASTGHAFAWNTKGSVCCSIFLKFIYKIWCFIEKWCHTKADKCLFILDNATIHQSRKIINFWEKKNKNIPIAFIPPYTPELAPIEKYFSVLKNIMLRKTVEKELVGSQPVLKMWLENEFCKLRRIQSNAFGNILLTNSRKPSK